MSELTKAAEKATETATGLLSRIFGPAADNLGELMASGLRLRLVNNQVRGLKKLKAQLDNEGVSLKQVDIKAVFPYLQGISVEEDERLENMWSNLMTNYLDAKVNLTSHVYPSILKDISSDEAHILSRMASGGVFVFEFPDGVKLYTTEDQFEVVKCSLNNLRRLGLIEYMPIRSAPQFLNTQQVNQISGFGKDFIAACTRSKK